jgi:hypothetical protein
MASENEVRLQLKGGRSIKIIRTETPTGGMWSIPEMPEIAAHQNISVIRDRLRGKGLIASRPGEKEQFGKHEMKLLDIRNQFFRAYGNAIHEAKLNADSRAAQSDDAILRAAWSEMSGTNYGGAIKTLDRISSFMRSKSSVAQMKKAANDAATEYRQNKLAILSQYDRFSRSGAKATFKVEDRFYFGKGRKERFGASDKVDGLIATAYRALRNGDKAAARRLIASAEALVQSDSSVPNYIVNELKDLKKSLSF